MKGKLIPLLRATWQTSVSALFITAFPFLLIHLITAGVMVILRPDESIYIGCMILSLSVGFSAFMAGSGNILTLFPLAVRLGSSRKMALSLTLSMTALQTLTCLAGAYLLLLFERCSALPLWQWLSRNPGLLVDDFGLVWWGPLLGWGAGFLLGLCYAAGLLRFGSKAQWGTLTLWLVLCALFPRLPWKTHEVTDILFPVLTVLLALGVLASLRSLLRHCITS